MHNNRSGVFHFYMFPLMFAFVSHVSITCIILGIDISFAFPIYVLLVCYERV
ncbi:hypothetical protein HanPSC8_Chr04g0135491 [Helianthus annuus]|nr:hypothetical protein HanPSC8_Chr04g0135491 [Helianthus annuus]